MSVKALGSAEMLSGLSIRLSVAEDMEHWKNWVADPKVSRWFPFASEEIEIDRTARHVFSFLPQNGLITAEWDGQPCGIAGFELSVYRKTMHQATLWIVVEESHRNQGIGSLLLKALFAAGKAWHGLSFVLLEVYEGNPARALYKRMGFVDYGFQPFFSKEDGHYLGRHLMCRPV